MSFDINNAKGVFATVDAAIEATHKAQREFYVNYSASTSLTDQASISLAG
ncbi:hypothetical protein AAFX24_02690 [Vibrio mediterranei]